MFVLFSLVFHKNNRTSLQITIFSNTIITRENLTPNSTHLSLLLLLSTFCRLLSPGSLLLRLHFSSLQSDRRSAIRALRRAHLQLDVGLLTGTDEAFLADTQDEDVVVWVVGGTRRLTLRGDCDARLVLRVVTDVEEA